MWLFLASIQVYWLHFFTSPLSVSCVPYPAVFGYF